MPIYDNNGTTNFEIKKVFDNDGTTSHQISTVYDNNGSVNSLVYSADLQIYPPATVTKAKGQNTNGTVTVGDFFVQNRNTSGTNAIAYIAKVDITDWNTCEITVSWDCSEYASLFVGVSPGISLNLPVNIQKTATAVFRNGGQPGSANTTYTLNIAPYSGVQDIGIATYSGSVVQAEVNATISKIVLK